MCLEFLFDYKNNEKHNIPIKLHILKIGKLLMLIFFFVSLF